MAILAGVKPLSGRLDVQVDVYPPDNRRRDLDNLLIMQEIANEEVSVVTPDENLASVLRKFTEHEVDILPVVGGLDSRKILGMIRRRDVITGYYSRISELRATR